MHILLRRAFPLAAFVIVLAAGGAYCAAGQNTVLSIDLEQLDQMLAAESRPMAIVFMAAWCMPCIEELPAVNELYEKYSDSGLHILGLSLDLGGPRAIQPFIDQHKVAFPVYWVGEEAIKAYQIRGIPLILLVKNGNISERIVGKRSKKSLDRRFAEFLK
jgi:thiol-disulfide isomerase/thioredoxin